MGTEYINDFQTPEDVARYMASLLPPTVTTAFEPTKGRGNLVRALERRSIEVTAPDDYFLFDLKKNKFDAVVMNPPFAAKYAIMDNADIRYSRSGMKLGYQILLECMKLAPITVALMPAFTISDSDVRARYLMNYGLVSITALPRSTFKYARIQTYVILLQKGYTGKTEWILYDKVKKEGNGQLPMFI